MLITKDPPVTNSHSEVLLKFYKQCPLEACVRTHFQRQYFYRGRHCWTERSSWFHIGYYPQRGFLHAASSHSGHVSSDHQPRHAFQQDALSFTCCNASVLSLPWSLSPLWSLLYWASDVGFDWGHCSPESLRRSGRLSSQLFPFQGCFGCCLHVYAAVRCPDHIRGRCNRPHDGSNLFLQNKDSLFIDCKPWREINGKIKYKDTVLCTQLPLNEYYFFFCKDFKKAVE